MKKLNSSELTKAIRHSLIIFIVSFFFLIGTLILIYIGYQEYHHAQDKAIGMNELTGDINKLEGRNAYIDIAMSPFLFASYKQDGKESDNKFYLVMDKDNFLYVVYMSSKDYQKLNKKNERITGVTEKITTDIKELAIKAYNKELGEEYLTIENFDEFVGPIMLNTTYIIDNSELYYIGSIVCFCMFIVFMFHFVSTYFKNRKVLKKYSKEDLEKIGMQIYGMGHNPYQKMKLYLTKDYVVDLSQGLTILKYDEIIWAYPYEYRYNGLLVNKNVKIVDTENQAYDIANTRYIKKDKEKVIDEVIEKLKRKNKNITIGYSDEMKKSLKSKKKPRSNKTKDIKEEDKNSSLE